MVGWSHGPHMSRSFRALIITIIVIRMPTIRAQLWSRLHMSRPVSTIADAGARDRMHIADTMVHAIFAVNADHGLIRQGPLGN